MIRFVRLQLHGTIYRPDSFVLMRRYCVNLKAIRYESTSLKRIVADKSHHVIVASVYHIPLRATETSQLCCKGIKARPDVFWDANITLKYFL